MSILRKNIGRIYLNQVNDPYIDIWNVSNTERKNRLANLPYRDFEKERLLEERITKEINDHFTFSLIEVNDKAYRLYLEMAIRSEEHTSELQSRGHLVCRLLLEKKNRKCL